MEFPKGNVSIIALSLTGWKTPFSCGDKFTMERAFNIKEVSNLLLSVMKRCNLLLLEFYQTFCQLTYLILLFIVFSPPLMFLAHAMFLSHVSLLSNCVTVFMMTV